MSSMEVLRPNFYNSVRHLLSKSDIRTLWPVQLSAKRRLTTRPFLVHSYNR